MLTVRSAPATTMGMDYGPHPITQNDGTEFASRLPFVTDLQTPHESPISSIHFRPVGERISREITLSPERTERLGNFFLNCYSRLPGRPGDKDWDCHSFVNYMVESSESFYFQDQEHIRNDWDPRPVNPRRATPNAPYGLFVWTPDGKTAKNIHSVLALPKGQSISSRGINSHLIVADNKQLMHEYGAQTMHRLFPPQA